MVKTRKLQVLKGLVFLTIAAFVATASLIPLTIQANDVSVDQPSS